MGFRQATISGCCKDCKDRHLACHDSCEKYQEALGKWKEHKAVIKKNKAKESMLIDYSVNQVKRMKSTRKTF